MGCKAPQQHGTDIVEYRTFLYTCTNSMPRGSSHPPSITGASRVSGPSIFISSYMPYV
ncbi:hypothetical protein DPMN_111718 [Dreissena polymorpha]|uniref:Uncharacterized protein n=1 Tax=Dreissena polymorpha TaxID=45954 RepID=A0A9D4KED2_DREPO|nr:hypothetical protein DPMN_111718 [Dreissena polymorpha]